MENHLFSPRALAVLRHPARWRFVASGFPADVSPVDGGGHDAWARRHVDAHPHREILMVLDGGGYHGFAGRSYPTRPGTVFLFDIMQPHDLSYPPDHPPAEHLWIYFIQGECGVSLMQVGNTSEATRSRIVWQRWHSLTEMGLSSAAMLFPAASAPAPHAAIRQRCVSALSLLVASLVEKGYEPPDAARGGPLQADVIQAIVRHIYESRGRGCRLDNLARIAGYSKYHFLRLFEEHAGMSPLRCVDDARLRAYRKLAAAGMPLKTLAHALGFAHTSTLCRWRRRQRL